MENQNAVNQELENISQNRIQKAIVAIACTTFFPMVYVIGKTITSLL